MFEREGIGTLSVPIPSSSRATPATAAEPREHRGKTGIQWVSKYGSTSTRIAIHDPSAKPAYRRKSDISRLAVSRVDSRGAFGSRRQPRSAQLKTPVTASDAAKGAFTQRRPTLAPPPRRVSSSGCGSSRSQLPQPEDETRKRGRRQAGSGEPPRSWSRPFIRSISAPCETSMLRVSDFTSAMDVWSLPYCAISVPPR